MVTTNKIIVSRIVFTMSIFTSLYWILSYVVNVYQFAILGAIFEILWLPMIGLLFILPIFSLIYFFMDRFNPKSLYLYAFLSLIGTILFMFMRN